ncbi:MAG: DUF2752 domain-containing protein [bacterium]
MLSINYKKDLKLSLEIAWIIYSLIILSVLILSAFFPEVLIKISPVCISKMYYGEECFMCGMTRAFVEISKGDFSKAYSFNNFSLILFSLFVLNELLFLYYSLYQLRSGLNLKKLISKFQI